MGSEVDIDLVTAKGRTLLVVGAYQLPAPAGHQLRRTYHAGGRLAVELARRECGRAEVLTIYIDPASLEYSEVRHVEGLRRSRRRLRSF